jgi:hypothetical protein
MPSAIDFWHPMASILTTLPAMSTDDSKSGIAFISLVFLAIWL